MRKYHLYLGLWTSVLVLMLSITGLLLMHKKELGLNRVMVSLPGGSQPSGVEPWQILALDDRIFAATKQGLYLYRNGVWQHNLPVAVRSIKAAEGRLYAATRQGVYESEDMGEHWRQYLPDQDIRALACSNSQLVAAGTDGIFSCSASSGQWKRLGAAFAKPLDVREVTIIDGRPLLVAKEGIFRFVDGKLIKERIEAATGSTDQVELQKIINDLHNGKFGGGLLIAAIDLTAISLIFLTVSGIWIWWVPRRNRQQKRVFH